jgi:broad specificity phosphatase PhoE
VAEIYLARHGETQANAEGRVQGWLDPPLNERGRDQARRLAHEVRPLGLRAIYTSQLQRAIETAQIVGEALGLEPHVDERFAESRRGDWEGKLLREIERDYPDGWRAWRRGGDDFRFPGGGESLAEHAERVEAGLAEVAVGDLPALVVCHGGSVRCAIAVRRPEGLAAFSSIAVPNASVTRLP